MGVKQTKPRKPTGKMALNRSSLVRRGKKLRKRINPYIKRYSKVGATPILDDTHFPWLKTLEVNWEIIRDEALDIMKYRDAIPSLADISPDHALLDDCLLYTSPSPRDATLSRMPSSA